MNKSLEIVNEALEFQIVSTVKLLGNIDKKIFKLSLTDLDTIKQDLERLELIEALYNKSLKEMETIKNDDRELYLKFKQLENENEQLKQQRDSLAINNGELCVKVCNLEKENQELKDKLNSEALDNWQLHCKYGEYKKAIEILKNKRVNIDLLLNSSECPTYNFYAKKQDLEDLTQEEYELLKEVLKSE